MVIAQAALASHRLSDRNACLVNETPQEIGGLGINHAATGDNQRPLAGTYPRCRLLQRIAIRAIARNMPHALVEKRLWICIRLGLHILWQRQGDSAGFSRAGQDAHNLGQRGQQLLRACNAIPVATHGLEAIIDGNILGVAGLELLQDGRDVAAGENISRQQQHRQAVDRGSGSAGDHIGRSRADR